MLGIAGGILSVFQDKLILIDLFGPLTVYIPFTLFGFYILNDTLLCLKIIAKLLTLELFRTIFKNRGSLHHPHRVGQTFGIHLLGIQV